MGFSLPLSLRKRITAEPLRNLAMEEAVARRSGKQCLAFNWYPLFEWEDSDVYHRCGHSIAERDQRRVLYQDGRAVGNQVMMAVALADWHMHPGYCYGMSRISCSR